MLNRISEQHACSFFFGDQYLNELRNNKSLKNDHWSTGWPESYVEMSGGGWLFPGPLPLGGCFSFRSVFDFGRIANIIMANMANIIIRNIGFCPVPPVF